MCQNYFYLWKHTKLKKLSSLSQLSCAFLANRSLVIILLWKLIFQNLKSSFNFQRLEIWEDTLGNETWWMRERESILKWDEFLFLAISINNKHVEKLRLRDSYKRVVKTWIHFANPWIGTVSWITNPDFKRFVSYRGSRILTLKDSFRIVSHESSQFSKIHPFLRIQRILTNP